MKDKKKEHPKEKFKLHPRNAHRERYDFKKLIITSPELELFVKSNIYGDESIDFFLNNQMGQYLNDGGRLTPDYISKIPEEQWDKIVQRYFPYKENISEK